MCVFYVDSVIFVNGPGKCTGISNLPACSNRSSSPVTPICKRSNDQTEGVAQIFVTVHVFRTDHFNNEICVVAVVTQLT